MSLILELRGRRSHAGTHLVHPTSEHVVLATVLGVVKNLPVDLAINPWLSQISAGQIAPAAEWTFSFWERQPHPVGVREGATEVDLVMSSDEQLIFVEVKMDAAPSAGTAHDPLRNQLVRNLDIGRRRSTLEAKQFSLVYITPDEVPPAELAQLSVETHSFPSDRLFWSAWGSIGDPIARAIMSEALGRTERQFALELLAYLANKGLWRNSLSDSPEFYRDKPLRPLRISGSPFQPYTARSVARDESWRAVAWDEQALRKLLRSLRPEDKALLKLLADAGGALYQAEIMAGLSALRGRESSSLRALKSHVNAACKGHGNAPILSHGSGAGDRRLHQINPLLGALREVVIEEARAFEVPPFLFG